MEGPLPGWAEDARHREPAAAVRRGAAQRFDRSADNRLAGLGPSLNAGADVAGYVGAHLAHTPLGLMAPNWHPFIDVDQTNQMAGDLAETFKNPPPIFGGGASPMSGVHALAALPAAVDATKMFKGARSVESAGNKLPNVLSLQPQQPQPDQQAAIDQPPQPPAGPMAAPWWQQLRMPTPPYTGYLG